MTPPPVLSDPVQERRDRQHLDLLAVFHLVVCGLGLMGLGFLFLHYSLFNTMLSNPNFIKSTKHVEIDPAEMFHLISWLYVVFGVIIAIGMLLNLLSALFLRRRICRTFSLVVAGLNCVHIPLGTALGVCTFIVLFRDSVQRLYAGAGGSAPGNL